MSTFTDDFNRGDGGLSNGWILLRGAGAISSNAAVLSGSALAYNQQFSAAGRQEVLATWYHANNANDGPYLATKLNVAGTGYYSCYTSISSNVPTYNLQAVVGGSSVASVQAGGSSLSTGWHTARLLYFNGVSTLSIDGAFVLSLTHSGNGANTLAGLGDYPNPCTYDDVTIVGDEAVSLTVTPSPIGNFGSSTDISLTGIGTAWTTGTPGAPTFTVDHGVLTNQEVTSTSAATATYTPGNYLGIATFADPSTGATVQVTVTSDTTVVFPPSGVGGLSEAVIGWLDDQAAQGGLVLADSMEHTEGGVTFDLNTILADLHVSAYGRNFDVNGEASAAKLLWLIWGALSGFDPLAEIFDSPTTSTSVKQDTEFTVSRFASSGPEPWTIDQLANLLAGDPFASHQDILTEIAALDFDDTAILEAIAGVKGDPLATIKAVLDYLFAMRTVSEWTLGNVKDWVEAVRGSGQPTVKSVMDKLALIQPGTVPSLNDIDEHLSVFGAAITAMDLVLGGTSKIPGTVAYIVDDIWDAIQYIQDVVGTGKGPLWPGVANVTLGTEVALSDGLEIEGPLHGLLITITGYPVRTQKYEFGAVNSWSRVGAVIFATDRGDYERSQTFSLDRQVLNPQTMEVAASAILRVNEGWEGTVRGWTRNS